MWLGRLGGGGGGRIELLGGKNVIALYPFDVPSSLYIFLVGDNIDSSITIVKRT